MPFAYDRVLVPAFPCLPVIIVMPGGGTRSPALSGLIDTGADATLVPMRQLRAIAAEEIYRARVRSHWGEQRTVTVFLVDLDVAGYTLPGIEVVGDDLSEDILLGRNALNRLILLLDGPAGETDILSKNPRQR